jgi:hypothetical protein
MNTTSLIALAVLVVLVVLYIGRRRARLRREDID